MIMEVIVPLNVNTDLPTNNTCHFTFHKLVVIRLLHTSVFGTTQRRCFKQSTWVYIRL